MKVTACFILDKRFFYLAFISHVRHILRYLLDNETFVSVRKNNDRQSPIHRSFQLRHIDAVKLLIVDKAEAPTTTAVHT